MKFTKGWIVVLLLMLFGLAGCPELGQIDGLGGYGSVGGGDLAGEIRNIDTRNREIQLRTDDGRNLDVRYDDRTRVTFRQRDYEVSNLEPGDYIAMRTPSRIATAGYSRISSRSGKAFKIEAVQTDERDGWIGLTGVWSISMPGAACSKFATGKIGWS